MTFGYNWNRIDTVRGLDSANRGLDGMRAIRVQSSQLKRCTVRPTNFDDHTMRYRLYRCFSSACDVVGPDCAYWVKTLSYEVAQGHVFFDYGRQHSSVELPQEAVFTHCMKQAVPEVPALKQGQNIVYNYKRTKMANTDLVAEMVNIAQATQFSDALDDVSAFTFGYQLSPDGAPIIGDGSDEEPLMIGISTKRLIRNADNDSGKVVFHMDATFKLSACGYPFIVVGVSDAARQFHPMAFSITSQWTSVQYAFSVKCVTDLFFQVTKRKLDLRYFMGDAEDAQFNAYQETRGLASLWMDTTSCFLSRHPKREEAH